MYSIRNTKECKDDKNSMGKNVSLLNQFTNLYSSSMYHLQLTT